MYTRIAEALGSKYSGINNVTVREIKKAAVTLDGFGKKLIKQGHGSGEGMFLNAEQLLDNQPKTLDFTFCNDNIIHVRYSKTVNVIMKDTEMTVADFSNNFLPNISHSSESITVRLKNHTVVINKNPYSVKIYSSDNKKIFASSNGECNSFKPLDSFSIGNICYGERTIRHNPEGIKYEYGTDFNQASVCVESFDLDADEHIYGFGEHFTGLDKKYQTIDLWTEDALGPVTQRQYKPVPFFVSTHNYGVFVNDYSPMTFWVGSMSNIRTVLAVENDSLDYYIILGENMKEVISSYCFLTGKPTLPPKWSFGFWLSKFSYRSQEEALTVVSEMQRNGIPFDVFHLDTHWFENDWICDLEFGKTNFPNPKEMIKRLHDNGIHLSLWQMPYFDDRSPLFQAALEKDFFSKDGTGSPALWKSNYGMTYGVLDVSNPDAINWWKDKFRALFELGADVIKTDFGEGAPSDTNYFSRMSGRSMHNAYPLLYNKALYEVTQEYKNQPFVWARSAWAGSQRYPLHWGGDNSGYFEQIVPQLSGGLSLMMSGFAFWSQDIAGFGNDIDNLELYLRWFALGLFMSHARLHGVGEREPYRFGNKVQNTVKKLLNLRYSLIPYIYSCAYQSVKESVALMRPLVLDFQNDLNTFQIADQFMFGESILVAPIVTSQNERRAYLPNGCWYNFFTGEKLIGGNWINIHAELDEIPLYVKSGAIIPTCVPGSNISTMDFKNITLNCYGGEPYKSFHYYDDNAEFDIILNNDILTSEPENIIFTICKY